MGTQLTLYMPSAEIMPPAPPVAPCGPPEAVPDCEWVAFLKQHGRVPRLSDERKPWTYKGWLLYYRLMAEERLPIAPRWDYLSRTLEAGHLLDEPLPQIGFAGYCDKKPLAEIEKWVTECAHKVSDPMNRFLEWFLWGFGLAPEPPQMPDTLAEYLYREVNIGPWLMQPHDYLGDWISAQKGSWNPHAFFPTPHEVVECMVQMNFASSQGNGDMRTKTVCDPCVGSGRMLLHASNYSLRLYGCDIDPMMVAVTKINGALYVPWMVRSLPESWFENPILTGIECRDSIRNPPLQQGVVQ